MSRPHPSGTAARAALRIAIVGSGPRGLAVLERLAVHLAGPSSRRGTEIFLIDECDIGAGRIWRPDQPEHFITNTVAGEVAAFSGPADEGPVRAGAGPSFIEWWRQARPGEADVNGYPPRALYGAYMHEVLAAVARSLSGCGVALHRQHRRVTDLSREDGLRVLCFEDGERLAVDRVVLATGHARPATRAAAGPLRQILGDSPADMPLADIPAGARVGILGLGLSFYDVMAALTEGRGGRFVPAQAGPVTSSPAPEGALRYLPSGREPLLFAGSRSAVPVQSRGRNQKPAAFAYQPSILLAERLAALHQHGQTRFKAQILPLLEAELNLVYLETRLRLQQGAAAAQALRAEVERQQVQDVQTLWQVAGALGAAGVAPLRLAQVVRPFDGARFDSPQAFAQALAAHLVQDVEAACAGNVDSPFKAAMDVLRDVRSLIRPLIDFGGLHPDSHRQDLIEWYSPASALAAAGPPVFRTRQLLALMSAGVLQVVGPGMQVARDDTGAGWRLVSPQVEGSAVAVDLLIDARIPTPDIRNDPSPLTQALLRRGIWRPFVSQGGGARFESGGVDVSASPYHPLDAQGRPDLQLHVLGIPTEHTRWFTQVGSTRPGHWTDFVADADAIATRLLAPVQPAAQAQVAAPPQRALEGAPGLAAMAQAHE